MYISRVVEFCRCSCTIAEALFAGSPFVEATGLIADPLNVKESPIPGDFEANSTWNWRKMECKQAARVSRDIDIEKSRYKDIDRYRKQKSRYRKQSWIEIEWRIKIVWLEY